MVRVADEAATLPPDLNDISIRYAECGELVVDVSADASLELFITPVYNLIIGDCLDRRHPVVVIAEHLERIRRAFGRAGSEISEIKQIGLVGEMIVMLHIMIPAVGTDAVHQWSGPLSERHDFVSDRVHVEVKSTTKSMDQHEISRLDQLRTPEGTVLLLASVQLERSIAGAITIATMRDAILAQLGNNGFAIDAFERKIQKMGWNEGLVQSGTLLRFNLRSLSVFEVKGSFPRLPDEYVPPRGVVGITYTINVSACPTMLAQEVVAILGAPAICE
jgi:hypothetical protein